MSKIKSDFLCATAEGTLYCLTHFQKREEKKKPPGPLHSVGILFSTYSVKHDNTNLIVRFPLAGL